MTEVSGLFVYPVKSCAGSSLNSADVTATGFAWDRRWMVVGDDGRFLSQREHPELVLIRPRIAADSLLLAAPRLPEVAVGLVRDDGPTVRVTVWADECEAVDEGPAVAQWLSEHLGRRARLVRLAGDDVRPLNGPAAEPGDRVSFADAYPFLLVSQASLDELNRRLALPVPMDRFRPNIVVAGCGAHAEDRWRHVRIGGIDFRVAKPCARCAVVATDQQTARRGPEPLRTLADYRLRDGKVMFGQNLVHGGPGTLAIHDPVVVLASRHLIDGI